MNARPWFPLGLAAFAAALPTASAQSTWLDKVDEALSIQNESGSVRADLSGLLDVEGYYIDQHPPGLLFSDDDWLFSPRLSLFLDLQLGPHFYSLTQVRFDRGFDPGSVPDGDVRLDEYLLRWTPWTDARLNLQAGKFATTFGEWVNRHDSWQNPFINAPSIYTSVLTITDHVAPPSAAGFVARKNVPDLKDKWLPAIWGPAYTSGASVFGLVDRFDYAFEFKNASISSRPYAWDATDVNWEHPTVSGRIGMRPTAAWKVGTSFSHGAYMLPPAEPTLPAGTELSDFPQTTVGADVSYAWHRLQLWAEAMATRFDVPRVGDADSLGYFVEAKYKLTTQLFGAVRWNQMFFNPVNVPGQGPQNWDQDQWRVDLALGWRLDRHLQAKIQYGYSHQQGPHQQGEQMVAAQVTLKF